MHAPPEAAQNSSGAKIVQPQPAPALIAVLCGTHLRRLRLARFLDISNLDVCAMQPTQHSPDKDTSATLP